MAEVTAEVTTEVTTEDTPQVTPQVERLLRVLKGVMDRESLQAALDLKDRKSFRTLYLQPALAFGPIAMTIPDKPQSRLQSYRITPAGEAWLATRIQGDKAP